jgi:fibronectin type 3 domain-containing protein
MKKVSAGVALLALLAGLAVSGCEPTIFGDAEDSTGIFGGGKEDGLSAPQNFTVSGSGATISLSWSSVSGASNYSVYRSTNGSTGTYSYLGHASGFTYYTDYQGSSTYYYKVAAVDYEGNPGTQSSAKTAGGGGGATLPAPTTVYAQTQSSSSIQITWDYVSGASGYKVYRSTSSSGAYTEIAEVFSISYLNNTGLSSKTTYYYKVATVNSSGTGVMSTTYYSATTF